MDMQYVPLVHVYRGKMVESIHYGAACVVDWHGDILAQWGNVEQLVYPRSAIKSLQALALVESGAADAYNVSAAELALACASHNGEVAHTEQVMAWLKRLGLSDQDLECGRQKPAREDSLKALYDQDLPVTCYHNNCSGKHSGFLTLARHMGWQTSGYIQQHHPLQRMILQNVAEMAETDVTYAPVGIDGCGIPVMAIPLQKIAFAAAKMAACAGGVSLKTLSGTRRAAAKRIIEAQIQHPFNIAGTDRYCSKMMTLAGQRLFLKVGAEGVYFAGLPEKGIGIAVKISDGASRAAENVVGCLLHRFGGLADLSANDLQDMIQPELTNWVGTPVGHIETCLK